MAIRIRSLLKCVWSLGRPWAWIQPGALADSSMLCSDFFAVDDGDASVLGGTDSNGGDCQARPGEGEVGWRDKALILDRKQLPVYQDRKVIFMNRKITQLQYAKKQIYYSASCLRNFLLSLRVISDGG